MLNILHYRTEYTILFILCVDHNSDGSIKFLCQQQILSAVHSFPVPYVVGHPSIMICNSNM